MTLSCNDGSQLLRGSGSMLRAFENLCIGQWLFTCVVGTRQVGKTQRDSDFDRQVPENSDFSGLFRAMTQKGAFIRKSMLNTI
jgi:hypothetical protein